jgi:hypothetical protein
MCEDFGFPVTGIGTALTISEGLYRSWPFLITDSEEHGAPGGIRTPELLVRRRITRTTANDSSTQGPKESTRDGHRFRLVSVAVVPCSRTITRTIHGHAKIKGPEALGPGSLFEKEW